MTSQNKDNYTLTNHSTLPAPLRDSMISILRNWDDNTSNHGYLPFFTPNTSMVFGPGPPKQGRSAIRAARDSMIHPTNGPIVQCTHDLKEGYVLGGSDEKSGAGGIIITATVTYDLVNGKKVSSPVASLARFVEGREEEDGRKGENLQAEYYEVFMDLGDLMTAIQEMNAKGS